MRSLVVLNKAANIPPSTALVFYSFRRPPFPRPVESCGRTATCCIVSDQFDVRVFVKVWICVEFSRDQVLQVFITRRKCKCQAVDEGVGGIRSTRDTALPLTNDEAESEIKLIFVAKARYEEWQRRDR